MNPNYFSLNLFHYLRPQLPLNKKSSKEIPSGCCCVFGMFMCVRVLCADVVGNDVGELTKETPTQRG